MGGEFDLIALLRGRIRASGADASKRVALGSGDDAAVSVPGGATATSVDAVVDGVHFRRATFPPEAIGAKALAAALSDLAGMAAEPGEAYVQLGIPDDAGDEELARIADGMATLAAEHGVAIAGGDVTASPVLFLAVTVVGHGERPESLLRRSGARPGEALLVTGPLGGAAAGLLLLEGSAGDAAVGEDDRAALLARQLRPEPRFAAGRVLAEAGATALIDVSDGLAGDAGHLAAASGVRVVVDAPDVPVQRGVREVATAVGRQVEELALGGGEDYELLASVPAERLEAALEALRSKGLDPAGVGRVETGEGVVLRGATGRELAVRGFDQVRSRARASPT